MTERTVAQGRRHLETVSPGGVIDCYLNGNPPQLDQGFWAHADHSFGRTRARSPATADELAALMEAAGITRALLAPPPETAMSIDDGYRWAYESVQAHPERFGLTVRLDPRTGMHAVRRLEQMVTSDGAVALRLVPHRVGLPPTDRIYFPLYTKCVELGIPVTVQVGIMTQQVAGTMQDASYLDELCALWPELTVVACHGCDFLSSHMLERLLTKWPNLYYVMSGFAPHRYPSVIVDLLNSSRGRSKVMFASDYPALTFDRVVTGLPDVGVDERSWAPFLHDNAERVFGAAGTG